MHKLRDWSTELAQPLPLPRLSDHPTSTSLGEFAFDLRSEVFRTQTEAARHFNVVHTTIGRYESEKSQPPLGYLAELVRLVVDRRRHHGHRVQDSRKWFLVEINKAIPWFYDYQNRVGSWGELCAIAEAYLAEQWGVGSLGPDGWEEAPDSSVFLGRQTQLANLEQWILTDHCRLVGVFGQGGVGKTALVAKLGQQIKRRFTHVIWRSLQYLPPPEDVLTGWVTSLSDQPSIDLPEGLGPKLSLLMEYLGRHRCLLVLDNAESILKKGESAGQYREGYEGYGRVIQRIGETPHKSSLVLTSREKPKEFVRLEGQTPRVRTLELKGLEAPEAQELLERTELIASEDQYLTLIERCAGNPLILNLVCGTIREMFVGDVARFLAQGTTVFGDGRDVLDEQFDHLPGMEKDIMYSLAIGRETVSIERLSQDIGRPVSQPRLLEALESLRRRFLLETNLLGFTLQPVIMEYVTDRFVERIVEEITSRTVNLFNSHALVNAQAKEYVRNSQVRIILEPIVQGLLATRSKEAVEDRLTEILCAIREKSPLLPGYAGGNVLSILSHLESDLTGYDFSRLTVWKADCRSVELHDVDFSHSDLVGSVFAQAFGNILSVAFSPDGKLLAIGATTGEVRVWRLADLQQMFVLEGHNSFVWSVVFSPDGRTLASGGDDHTVRLWDAHAGQEIKVLKGHEGGVRSVAFSPDGCTLATVSEDQTIRLWEWDQERLIQKLQGHTSRVWAVAFSPDGRFLASGGDDGAILLWNVLERRRVGTFEGHALAVRSIAFSPNGAILASGGEDQIVRLWDPSTTRCRAELRGHGEWVLSVAFGPDGCTLASGGYDQTPRIWDTDTGQCIATLTGHNHNVGSVAFSPDGALLASAGDDRTVRLWNVRSRRCLSTLQGYSNWTWSVTFSPDGRVLISGGDDHTIRFWDVQEGRCLNTLRGHARCVRSVALDISGQLLASGSDDETVRLWDARDGRHLVTFSGHSRSVQSVAFSPVDPVIASGSTDGTVRLWNLQTEECIATLLGHTDRVMSVAFSPDGRILASGSDDHTVCLWDVDERECLKKLNGPFDNVHSLAFCPNGHKLATGHADQSVRVWDVQSGECLNKLEGHTHWIWSIAFSSDGAILASGSLDRTIRLWNALTGQWLATLLGHTDRVLSVAFSPDGCTLASGCADETIKLWDVASGECVRTMRPDRPYERMEITNATGLTETERAALKMLGAVESP